MAIVIEYTGSDFMLEPSDLPAECAEQLTALGGSGDQTDAVAMFRTMWGVWGDVETCREYLDGYGAWEVKELADHDANLNRLVWLTGCAFAEGEPAHFCTY